MALQRMSDGRDLEYEVHGPEGGPVVVFHHGMPGSAVLMPSVLGSVVERGFRVVTYSRAGYGASSPAPGRSVSDAAADCVSLLALLDVAGYLAVGWSAGGPHALATAALAPENVDGVLLIASFAPAGAPGLDFSRGMGAQNVAQFATAAQGEPAVRAMVGQMASVIRSSDPTDVASSMASILSPVDAAVLVGEFGEDNAANMGYGLSPGDEGWVEDVVALTAPWGVDVAAVAAPVELWHGTEDRMVPVSHGRWLAGHLPHAVLHDEPGQGHVSLAVGGLADKLDVLAEGLSS